MTDSIVESFDALAAMAQDDAWAARFRKRVASALSAKESDRPAMLAAAYLDGEREIVSSSGGLLREDAVRAKMEPLFAKFGDRYPGLPLLLLPAERQFLELANAMIRAYAAVWKRVAGMDVTERAMRAALADSPWERATVGAETGLKADAMTMRTMGDLLGACARLFDGWYDRAASLIGEDANRAAFERAFSRLEAQFGFLPAFKSLLGATPLKTLGHEKAKRLHELERETSAQARDIRVADEDIRRRAEELKRTVAELEETKRKLEIVGKARSEFIDVVAHQFRTPLSSIRWNAELLVDAAEEAGYPPEHQEALRNMRTKSVYLIETLDRVFATLDIDTATMVLDIKPGFFWETVQDVVESYRKDFERKGMKLKFVRPKTQPEEISFDKNKLASALRVVIGNALSYGKDGGKIGIELGKRKTNGIEYQYCAVTDDGVGFGPGEADRAVEKFFRSKSAVLKAPDGTGLGMYIVKHYVEAHRGMLTVESPGADKGTTVTIALPIGK